jgi:hypothetical protein
MSKVSYLAGYFDADGGLVVRPHGVISISIQSVNKEIIEYFSGEFGGREYEINVKARENLYYRWEVHKIDDVLKLLEQIEPFLIVKKKRAQAAIQYLRSRSKKSRRSGRTDLEIALLDLISLMNKIGEDVV